MLKLFSMHETCVACLMLLKQFKLFVDYTILTMVSKNKNANIHYHYIITYNLFIYFVTDEI